MSLNNSQMLPERIRSMRQMGEVLDAEDVILAEIEQIIEEMYQRASLLHEELVNEAWLEKHIGEITGGNVSVSARKDSLHVDIVISRESLVVSKEEKTAAFINKWLPAHLEYKITCEQLMRANIYHAAVWQDDEIMVLRQIIQEELLQGNVYSTAVWQDDEVMVLRQVNI